MQLIINGDKKEFQQGEVSVFELLTLESVPNAEMVSVQLNGDFVAREDFKSTLLKAGDEIDFLYFMGGGAC